MRLKFQMQCLLVIFLWATNAFVSAEEVRSTSRDPNILTSSDSLTSEPEQKDAVADAQKLTLSLEDVDISILARWAAKITGKTVVLHPGVKGKITILAGVPLSTDEAYQVFLTALRVSGFAFLETDQGVQILPLDKVQEENLPLFGPDKKILGADVVLRVIKPRYVDVQQLSVLLKPLLPSTSFLSVFGDKLVVAERKGKIDQLMTIIVELDTQDSVGFHVVEIEHVGVNAILQVLKSYSDKVLKEKKPFHFIPFEEGGKILLVGDDKVRQDILKIVKIFDVTNLEARNELVTEVVKLKFSESEHIAQLLEGIIADQNPTTQSPSGTSVSDSPPNVKIRSDETLNSIVLTGLNADISNVKRLLWQLDKRRAQVLVEAVIVEVSDNVARDLNIQWLTGLDTNGANETFVSLTNPASSTVGLAPNAVFSVGYYKFGALRGLIQALESTAAANVLSTPSILTLDNEEASILVGENVPFISGSQSTDIGNGDPFQTITRQDVGLSLTVKPRIGAGDTLTLEIEQKVENVSPSNRGASDLVTTKREIKTKVLVDSDSVLVLGGLIREEIREQKTAVPLLSRIPLLGRLLRSQNNDLVKSNLLVFIRPVIIRDAEAEKRISAELYDEMVLDQVRVNKIIDRKFVSGSLPQLRPQALPSINEVPLEAASASRFEADSLKLQEVENTLDTNSQSGSPAETSRSDKVREETFSPGDEEISQVDPLE